MAVDLKFGKMFKLRRVEEKSKRMMGRRN